MHIMRTDDLLRDFFGDAQTLVYFLLQFKANDTAMMKDKPKRKGKQKDTLGTKYKPAT